MNHVKAANLLSRISSGNDGPAARISRIYSEWISGKDLVTQSRLDTAYCNYNSRIIHEVNLKFADVELKFEWKKFKDKKANPIELMKNALKSSQKYKVNALHIDTFVMSLNEELYSSKIIEILDELCTNPGFTHYKETLTDIYLYIREDIDLSILNVDNFPNLTSLNLTVSQGTLGSGISTLMNLTKFTLNYCKDNTNNTYRNYKWSFQSKICRFFRVMF